MVQPANPVVNSLEITGAWRRLTGRDAPITDVALREELRITQQMNPMPELHLRPNAETRYEVVDQVLATIKAEHVGEVGFVGNEST